MMHDLIARLDAISASGPRVVRCAHYEKLLPAIRAALGAPGPTPTLTLVVHPSTLRHLQQLVDVGLFGTDVAEAAERLLSRGIATALRDLGLPLTAQARSLR